MKTIRRHIILIALLLCSVFVQAVPNYTDDYLGNHRTVVSHEGTVEQVTHYYPFGAIYCAAGSNDALQPYKYNGKELDRMHGMNLYDYTFRQYDPLLCRFTQVDRKCEDYYNVSPYVYCLNNPVRFLDPNGEEPTEEEAARIADHVYMTRNVALIGGWKVSNRSINGVVYNNYRTGFKSALYERTINGTTEYVYATAGTDFSSLKDWANNFQQVFGQSEQYYNSTFNAKRIKTVIKDQELTYVGHSLGGGLAAANAYTTGDKALTFNAAWVSPSTIPYGKRKDAKIEAYVQYRDELNFFQRCMGVGANGNKHWRFIDRAILGHSIKNFYRSSMESLQDMMHQAQEMYNNSPFKY